MSVLAGVLAAVLVLGVATLVMLMAKGWLTLDTGWGRTTHRLGPLVVSYDAPCELVFEQLSAPYLGATPKDLRDKLEVVDRGADLVVAAHHTDLGWYTATTVESVGFDPPERITFRHLRGPVPHAVEEFRLRPIDGDRTELTYQGELGLDWWFAGWLAARYWVRPVWERQVASHLEGVKPTVEERARRRRAREQRRGGPGDAIPGDVGSG